MAVSPEYIRAGLIRRGMPPHVADAFVMNARDESGLDPGINEARPVVPGSRGGFGLMQWTGPRRRALEAFAADRGQPVGSPDVQMDFLLSELQGSERAAGQAIMSAQTPGEAAAAIVNSFLRPAEQHRSRREASYLGGAAPGYDTNALAQFGQQPVANALAGVPPVSPVEMIQQQAREMARQKQQQQVATAADMPMLQQMAEYRPQYDTTPRLTARLQRGA